MLPKLQQSSLAQSLRRDNPASHLQCQIFFIQAKINSKALLVNKLINAINHGRTILLLKILIHALETFLRSISPNKNSKMCIMNLLMNSHYLDLFLSTTVIMEMEVKHLPLSRKNANFKSQSLSLEHTKKEMCQLHSSGDIMIEEIFQLELTIKTLCQSQSGKFQWKLLIIIITYQFSSMELDKNMTLTEHLQFWEHTTFSTKEAIKFYQ